MLGFGAAADVEDLHVEGIEAIAPVDHRFADHRSRRIANDRWDFGLGATDNEAAHRRGSRLDDFFFDLDAEVPAPVRAQVDAALSCSACGDPGQVADQLRQLVQTYRPDELIVTGMIHDHAARLRSFEIAAGALADIQVATAAA